MPLLGGGGGGFARRPPPAGLSTDGGEKLSQNSAAGFSFILRLNLADTHVEGGAGGGSARHPSPVDYRQVAVKS